MNKSRFLLCALALASLAFSACSAPAAEFDHVTVASSNHEQPTASPVAVPAAHDFAIVHSSRVMRRTPAIAVAATVASLVTLFAVYRIAAPAAGSRSPDPVPWQA